jgi:hypothetical protein
LVSHIEVGTQPEGVENRVLRRKFGPKRDEVTGEWRKLNNEELNDLYSSPNIVWVKKLRRMKWSGHVACMRESKGAYRVLLGKSEGKRPLRRPRHRRNYYIKMNLLEADWIELTQHRDRWWLLVNAVKIFWVP